MSPGHHHVYRDRYRHRHHTVESPGNHVSVVDPVKVVRLVGPTVYPCCRHPDGCLDRISRQETGGPPFVSTTTVLLTISYGSRTFHTHPWPPLSTQGTWYVNTRVPSHTPSNQESRALLRVSTWSGGPENLHNLHTSIRHRDGDLPRPNDSHRHRGLYVESPRSLVFKIERNSTPVRGSTWRGG